MVGTGVSPFAKRGLDEALGLAVGLRRVRPSEDLAKTETLAGCTEGLSLVAGAVVGHHTVDANAKFGKISNGSFKEGDSTFLALIGHDLNESDARSIVDADMDELPTDTVVTIHRARMSPGNAVPNGAATPSSSPRWRKFCVSTARSRS